MTIEYTLGAGVASSGFLLNSLAIYGDALNNLMLGSGIMLGTFWSVRSEKKKPIMLTTNDERQYKRVAG